MSNVYLNRFEVVRPKNKVSQPDLLKWITRCHQQAEKLQPSESQMAADTIEKLFARYGVSESKISQRYMECDDVLIENPENFAIYNPYLKNGADISVRADFFSNRAGEIFKKFYDVSVEQQRPDHLIHVTCTGYVSPSAAQRIVTEKNWTHATEITHAYHMGCYAALPAVRLAQHAVGFNPATTIDIVHTEMCGLHMNPLSQTPEQMVVQTLFADGHIKYTGSSAPISSGKNLKIIALHERVVPDSSQDMSWAPAPWGLQMNLSREVPEKIKLELKKFSVELFAKAHLPLPDAMRAIFAIHPGGPKIIDAVKDVLELNEEQIKESRQILLERGNMSSATLPHVWNEILDHNYAPGTLVISYAFGPGLTLFGAVFEVC